MTDTLKKVLQDVKELKHWHLDHIWPDCECVDTYWGHEGCVPTPGMVAKRGGSFIRRKELAALIKRMGTLLDEKV